MRSNGPFTSDDSGFRLRQHGTFFFFTKNWLGEPIFREKDLVSFALPEAQETSTRATAYVLVDARTPVVRVLFYEMSAVGALAP